MAKKLEKVKTKEERIQDYLTELLEIYSLLDENKFTLVKPHLEQIAYMKVQLEELQIMIDETGLVERYQNGENQFGMKPSAAVKAYNDIIRSFSAETKFVESYLPAVKKVSKLSML